MTQEKYMRPGFDFALGKLVEECGEVLAACGKTQLWGPDSVNPELPPEQQETNRDWILREIADLEGAIANFKTYAHEFTPSAPPQGDG